MKTSELIKKVEEFGNGLSVVLTNGTLMLFADNGQTLICTVDETIITTQKERFAVNSPISNAIELMFEYAKTPLEEREEKEKRYKLKSELDGNTLQGYISNLIICQNKAITNLYFLSNKDYAEQKHIQTSFTQKEIDDMPFDTNFFIKEEVV